MGLEVEVLESIDKVDPGRWDALMSAADAPVFYRHRFLSAYESNPLQGFDRPSYLVAWSGSRMAAAIPAYLQVEPDALGSVAKVTPDGSHSAVMTHVLHCYDTRIVSDRLDEGMVDALCGALSEIAAGAGVEWFAFLNVDEASETFRLLREKGLVTVAMESRHVLGASAYGTAENWMSSVPGRYRREILRHRRRALEGDLEVTVESPPPSDLTAAAALLGRSAGEHETAGYYPPEKMARFLPLLGDDATLVSIRRRERLIACGVGLSDETRFHLWAGGVDYSAKRFSAYYLLFYEMMSAALASGRPVIEGGRGNAGFKQRFLLTPRPLAACVGRAQG